MKKRGFTLMEVNLAVFIMAVGVLAMVGLYPLGFRESQQSQDDVAGAILADAVLNPIVAALSSTNVTWQAWNNVCGGQGKSVPANGWKAFCKDDTSYVPGGTIDGNAVISRVKSAYSGGGSFDFPTSGSSAANGLFYALVMTQTDVNTIRVSFRATRRKGQLFVQPFYYTEVHFQGFKE
ncbi:MAG: prepilin-type N-terminal cleavage/methylation domain-containing protein [Kiritimatiellia bacterium]